MKYVKGDIQIEIEHHIEPESPREWDNLGVMVCWHKRYELGDKHDIKSEDYPGWGEVEEHLQNEFNPRLILPIYMMDHSGLSIQTHPFTGLYGLWDSGQIGFIYAIDTKETREMTLEHLEKLLIGEISTYNKYLRGEIYGFTKSRLKKCDLGETHEIFVDSCWGFYDMDSLYKSAGIDDLNDWEATK